MVLDNGAIFYLSNILQHLLLTDNFLAVFCCMAVQVL